MTSGGGWSDSTLGDVRPYTVTGGRTRPRHPLHLTTCLVTRPATRHMPMNIEHESLLMLCSGAPRSVAELAARLHQPVQVIKVLIGDLLDAEALTPANPDGPADPDAHLLEVLLDALRTKL
ncbi:DUF742 domain-containing protein [Streptomyces chromofuscus]|uniref:DUF742 domain-containing protein n=1 Tax=Streptomyces chromofuscus TaxID=42881 RepID=A0A7M2T2Z0_STRCW|nr:DUF742 domain-containing protein [Streptomyces chromofuscus]QOV43057.1 DUF742 domain-containing protein [Streptomyces chromofuscus]GGS93428.1 hypothetical protein GCM10010254_11770 [Streptomyces chromofuscus]